MKLKTYIIAILLITSSIFIASCGGLSGTYVSEDDSPDIDGCVCRITFDGNTCTLVDDLGFAYRDLDWEVRDDKLYVSGKFSSILGSLDIAYEYEFKKEGGSIYLDGIEFLKK